MHESKRQIGIALAPIMKANGYHKRGLTWHKQQPDTILVFHGEKSRWGADQYSFECGIYLRSLGDDLTPLYYRCHIRANLENLVPDKYECRQICDFEYGSFTVPERLDRIAEYVSTVALPWLDSYATLPSLRQLAQDYQKVYPRVIIWIDVLSFLQNVATGTN
ncbi:MAG TPA: DUF4304 domain-containing protein [Anaerovoracaceae bacterium]|nr:DUF4304 domain-containing protein [Anaerovoracaceae bacterium]